MWQYTYLTHYAYLKGSVGELNQLGAAGWEAVGITPDPAVSDGKVVILLKRWIGPWAAPPNLAPAWHPDPTGRYELRWWDGQRWTEAVLRGGVNSADPLAPGR